MQHLRIGSEIDANGTGLNNLFGSATNVIVTNITSSYLEFEYTWTPTEGATETRVAIRPWSASTNLRVLTD